LKSSRFRSSKNQFGLKADKMKVQKKSTCIVISLILTVVDVCFSFSPISSSNKFSSKNTHGSICINLHAQKQQQGKGYQQIGSPLDEELCSLSKEEILQILKERTKARRARNFRKADEILTRLKRDNVFVNDSTKQWRADGQAFVNYDAGGSSLGDGHGHGQEDDYVIYTKAGNSRSLSDRDEEYVKGKLRERYLAKLNRDYDTADDIIDELRFMKNVEIDDSKKTYRATDPFKLEYTFGGKRVNNIDPDVLKEIEYKVRERAGAKKRKDYDLADSLLKELTITHGIRVDDSKKEWHFMSKKNVERDERFKRSDDERFARKKDERIVIRRDDDERKNASEGRQGERRNRNNRRDSEWSTIDSSSTTTDVIPGVSLEEEPNKVSIPDGIVIEDDAPNAITVPDGIVIEDDAPNTISVPDGIVIEEDEPVASQGGDINEKKSDLESMTVPILKEKLREAGLPVSGRKIELIERLINRHK
jgi:hypothetical protein